MDQTTDILVIGSGIAGLTFALKVAEALPSSRVLIVTKDRLSESNTRYAQGGMAVVTAGTGDSWQKHLEDTLAAGDGLCDRSVAEMVIREAPARLQELIDWGAQFDTNQTGSFHLGREGGHSLNRIIHRGDFTGSEIERTLAEAVKKQKNIEVLPYHFAIDLLKGSAGEKGTPPVSACCGAVVADLNQGRIITIRAKVTMLAAGGIGQIFQYTTNPSIATGDAIAMANRAGAEIRNMEFVQFHPTALYDNDRVNSFLITEAVRGAGAILRNRSGERFMHRYHEKQELACRDAVSRAIKHEMELHGDPFVYLDCRHIPAEKFRKEFPTIFEKCRELGIDPGRDMIPVTPSAHYSCGGIQTDAYAKTSLLHLYACGECAHTGLHGANRLASNSLPEALVFAHRAAGNVLKIVNRIKSRPVHPENLAFIRISDQSVRNEKELLREKMTGIAIECTDRKLKETLAFITKMSTSIKLLHLKGFDKNMAELRNMLDVAGIVVESSLKRKKNHGAFFKKENQLLEKTG